jgi:signal transduction histidine kinase
VEATVSDWILELPAERLPVAVAETDASGRITRTNRRFTELVGADPAAGPGDLRGLLLAAGVDDPAARLAASAAAPQAITSRVGGHTRTLRLSSHPRPDGGAVHLLVDLRDHRAEHARHAELQSLIAHDLRSPLAVIQGYAGLLVTGTPGPLNPTQVEFLQGIDSKIIEVTRLLDDFLDLSRLDAGALTLNRQEVDLAELVAQVRDEHRRTAADRRITVMVAVEPAGLAISADPLRLKQILDNLVGNAVKYNVDGGWVRVEAVPDGDAVQVRVADGGPGLDDAERQRIFEPFARGDAGVRVAGTGLGLVVVERLVALHDGTITVSGAPGAGTIFTVSLPRRASCQPASEPVQ